MKIELNLPFVLNIVGAFLAFSVLTGLYILPWLRKLPRLEALRILTLIHAFRFMGLSFLIPGVVSPNLTSIFSILAAWGDFGAAVLALLSLAALTRRWLFAVPLVWLFNIWGSIDLLNAYYQGTTLRINPGEFGAAYYIPTMLVPLLLISHSLIFWLLAQPKQPSNMH
jgi:hypothetical protein